MLLALLNKVLWIWILPTISYVGYCVEVIHNIYVGFTVKHPTEKRIHVSQKQLDEARWPNKIIGQINCTEQEYVIIHEVMIKYIRTPWSIL